MGALSPVVTGIGALTTAIRTVDGLVGSVKGFGGDAAKDQSRLLRAQQDLALRQLQQQQAAGLQDMEERAALERARMTADTRAAESTRRTALRRAIARQRASFGSQGLGAGAEDGSSEAVLLGLFQESDTDRAARERLDRIRSVAVGQDSGNQRRINILQQAQLQERQKLERIAEGY